MFEILGGLVILAIPGLIWLFVLLLQTSDRKKHRQQWRKLAKISKMKYHSRGDATRAALKDTPGIDCPEARCIDQGISGTFKDCWFIAIESVLPRQTLPGTSKPIRATRLIMIDPSLHVPEFHLGRKWERLSAAPSDIRGASEIVDLKTDFSEQYRLQARQPDAMVSLFQQDLQKWFLEENPLQAKLTLAGAASATPTPLELYCHNQTIMLTCLSQNQVAAFEANYGPILARDIEKLLQQTKTIATRLSRPAA